MDDITSQYLKHLVQYEPFRLILPRLLEQLRQGYMRELLTPPAKRAVGVTDDVLRGKIEGLADFEKFVQGLSVAVQREQTERVAAPEIPAPEQPFARVRVD